MASGTSVGLQNMKFINVFVGTVIGALWSLFVLYIEPCEPISLFVLSTVFVWPVFHIMTSNPKYIDPGIITLLAFIFVAQNGYVLSHLSGTCVPDQAREMALQITYQYLVSVSFGILACTLISYLLWPLRSREEIQRLFDLVMGRLGELYLTTLPLNQGKMHSVAIHLKVNKTQELVLSILQEIPFASTELRLKKPFPTNCMMEMAKEAQKALDSIHTNCNIRDRGVSSFFHNVIQGEFREQRRQMSTQALLAIHILRASFRSKMPLPYNFPETNALRHNLSRALSLYEQERRSEIWSDKNQGNEDGRNPIYFFGYIGSLSHFYTSLEKMEKLAIEIYSRDSYGSLAEFR